MYISNRQIWNLKTKPIFGVLQHDNFICISQCYFQQISSTINISTFLLSIFLFLQCDFPFWDSTYTFLFLVNIFSAPKRTEHFIQPSIHKWVINLFKSLCRFIVKLFTELISTTTKWLSPKFFNQHQIVFAKFHST